MSDPDAVPPVGDLEATRLPAASEQAWREVGPYHLIQKVGEGGMGEVWLAEQTSPVHRQVAIKVIKRGMDSAQVVARFEGERQALAMMDHPTIAKVFDGATTPDGRPYFAMEYVRGEPITDYCDRVAMSVRDRLDLFARLCDGVQHAHQKGVIHRDLKPSNVLVAISDDRPTPRIIDFGIAKATARRLTDTPFYTEVGGFVGTPEYMSPEQADPAAVDVDTRADVYSLGVILYELLVGTLPHSREDIRSGGYEQARRILDQTPAKPSSRIEPAATELSGKRQLAPTRLIAAVRGDLDWITLKALERDRTRRYPTANALALDVRRHLVDEPVSAGPPGSGYRLRKFLRRHVVAVGAAAAAALALMLFSVVLLVQSQRLAAERDRANQEAATATQVTRFLIDLFNVSDPGEARGNSLTAREVLDKGASQLGDGLRDQPLVRVRLGTTIGTVYTNLGLYTVAAPLLERTVEVARETAGDLHPDTVAATNALAALYWYRRQYPQSIDLYQRVLDSRRATLGDTHKATLRAKYDLSSAYQASMQLDKAETLLRETLAQQRASLDADDPDLLESLNNLQALYYRSKKYNEALPIALEVLERQTKLSGSDHPLALLNAHNLGTVYFELRNLDLAERWLVQALEGRRRVLGRHHERTLATWERYAPVQEARGQVAAAMDSYKGILAEVGDDADPPYPEIATRALQHLLRLADAGRDEAMIVKWKQQLSSLQAAKR